MLLNCTTCEKEFNKIPSQVKKTKNHFCSRSCAATFNNKIYKKRNPHDIHVICALCETERTSYTNKFCNTCLGSKLNGADAKSQLYIKQWLNGEISGGGKYRLSNTVRNYLLEQHNYACSKCTWSEINLTTGKVPLDINHIDGDGNNHVPSNLEVLCPNCHALTSTYKSLNKGKGRDWVYVRHHRFKG